MSIDYSYERDYWTNRTACAVLEDIRRILKVSKENGTMPPVLALLAATEELQYAFSRMEAAISDLKDIKAMRDERVYLKTEIKKLRKQQKALKPAETAKTSPK